MSARVNPVLYRDAALVDTSAVFALFDETDQLHDEARRFFQTNKLGLAWYAIDTTAHESYTRVRYDLSRSKAVNAYSLLRGFCIQVVRHVPDDEEHAWLLLERYAEHALSFQDALCAAVMRRIGVFKVFTFDHDFWTMGFEVIPGLTARRR